MTGVTSSPSPSQKDILRGNIITPQTLNRYVYCINDPVNFIDPSGMRLVENDPREVRSDLIVPTGRAGTSGPSTNTNVSAKSAAQTAQNVRVQNRLEAIDERDSGSNSPSADSHNNDPSPASPQVAGPTGQSESCEEGNKTVLLTGREIAVAFGLRLSVNEQLFEDDKGNGYAAISIFIGGGTPNASLSMNTTSISLEAISSMEGLSWAVGGGSVVRGIFGVDVGENGSLSFGVGAVPAEMHGGLVYTQVIDIDTWLEIQDNIWKDSINYG